MSRFSRGLYETLITREIEAGLQKLDRALEAERGRLRAAEAPDRIALHLGRIVRRVLEAVPDDERVERSISLARALLERIDLDDVAGDTPLEPGALLRAIQARLPDGSPESIVQPATPLLDTTLLTNAPGEPRVGNQLLTEIHSADRIDVVMAFIRRTGIGPLLEALRAHVSRGARLRVLTTTYTGSTESEALDQLRAAGAEIRVSYDTSTTRLHAKAWLFHRGSGFSTAYIGSSNLTHSAQVTGLEWNVRVSGARNPDVIAKVSGVFEAYWNGGDFVPYDREQFLERTTGESPEGPRVLLSPLELRPRPFQERLLEQIALSREQGHHRNLLVAATGTGKTVMAAIDYANLRESLQRDRLLFVAHREEILDQSLAVFRYAIRAPSFGELWVGGKRPRKFEHVFASIQSLSAAGLQDLAPSHFDVVIVDEFHHAAAPSYRALLDHIRPVELLGLTATPERSDGLDLLHSFDGRIAAELRLWDAIDQYELSPFAYFGIHDSLDLREIPWRRGRGYDVDGLANLFTANDAWAKRVVAETGNRIDDPRRMRALGFCVNVAHARFMARIFTAAGIPAAAISAESPDDERRTALTDLAARRVNVVFSVDLFNEGIDVPTVDTLLLLRPTDSPTLFLQQLGRGLRKSRGKTICTVLDFVGHHRKEFRFDRRFGALLGGTRRELANQIEAGFPFLPAGCHMELDPVAQDVVLRSIREAIPSRWTEKVDELRAMAKGRGEVTLAEYLEETGLELEDVYAGDRCWSDLCSDAKLPVHPLGPAEAPLRRAIGRMLHVDDTLRIDAYQRLLASDSPLDPRSFALRERRLAQMLVASLLEKAVAKSASLGEGLDLLSRHPQVRAELHDVLQILRGRVTHLHRPLVSHPDVPLQVHARYTGREILGAFGDARRAKIPTWQAGVRWLPDEGTDVFAFTLDKTSGGFSPTTRYRDYAISRDLIHWESQSVTREDSDTGKRYQRHVAMGTHVMLFARLSKADGGFWFLGPATYVSHERELPMGVVWKLDHSLPGDLFAAFAAAVA